MTPDQPFFSPEPGEISFIEQIETALHDEELEENDRTDIITLEWIRMERKHGAKITVLYSPEGNVIERPSYLPELVSLEVEESLMRKIEAEAIEIIETIENDKDIKSEEKRREEIAFYWKKMERKLAAQRPILIVRPGKEYWRRDYLDTPARS